MLSFKNTDQTDLLRRELDSRFLDRAGLSTSSSSSNPPYLRQELHHHQHQHTHLHQHHQQIIPAVNAAASSTMFSAPLFKDIPKIGGVDSPFYRTGISVPMYATYPPTILHPSIGAATTQFIPQNSLSSFIPKVSVVVFFFFCDLLYELLTANSENWQMERNACTHRLGNLFASNEAKSR